MKKMLQILFATGCIFAGIASMGFAMENNNQSDESQNIEENEENQNVIDNQDNKISAVVIKKNIKAIDVDEDDKNKKEKITKIVTLDDIANRITYNQEPWLTRLACKMCFWKSSKANFYEKKIAKQCTREIKDNNDDPFVIASLATGDNLKNMVEKIAKKQFNKGLLFKRISVGLVLAIAVCVVLAIITLFILQLWNHLKLSNKMHNTLCAWKLLGWLGYASNGTAVVEVDKLNPIARIIRKSVDSILKYENYLKASMFNVFGGTGIWPDIIAWTQVGIAALGLGVAGICVYNLLWSLNGYRAENKFDYHYTVENVALSENN